MCACVRWGKVGRGKFMCVRGWGVRLISVSICGTLAYIVTVVSSCRLRFIKLDSFGAITVVT